MSDQDMLPDSGEGPGPIAPAEIPPPVPEDLLGLRIGAALIDLALLGGLFTILSAAVGQTTVSGEGFNVSLSGLWLVVFVAAALEYYFVLEAWPGPTLPNPLPRLPLL